MGNSPLRFTNVRTAFLVVAASLCFSTPAIAQSTATRNTQSTADQNGQYNQNNRADQNIDQNTDQNTDQDNSSVRDNNNVRARDNDRIPSNLTQFDRYLHDHPDINAQVQQKPWLLADYQFLQSHPDLNSFLKAHPQLNSEISQNPSAFIQLENRLSTPDGRRDLREYDAYLDSHPNVASQLRAKPWLAVNSSFLQSHPDLNTFLQDHPQLRTAIGQNPVAFMQDEEAVDRDQPGSRPANFAGQPGQGQDRDADRDRDNDHDRDADRDRRQDLAQFDRFLDSHREIAEQVRKNPSLLDNRDFVQNHPALQDYLRDNPNVRDEIRQDPNAFMHQEAQYNRFQNVEYRDNRQDLAQFNRFLDSHREIAEQVRKNPSLLDNRDFVQNHPVLQDYLRDNPGVRDEIRQDPNAFMHQEDRFQYAENWRDPDSAHQHMADFGQFLNGHSDISRDVSKDPSLVKNQEYVQNHPELDNYLNAHPDVRSDMMQNPDSFVKGSISNGASGSVGTTTNGNGSGVSTGTSATGSTHATGSTSTGVPNTSTAPAPKPKQ
jgi:hypothetical protein